MFKKTLAFILNHTTVFIVGTLCTIVGGLALNHYQQWAPAVDSAVTGVWAYLMAPIVAPAWYFGILILGAVVGVAAAVSLAWLYRLPPTVQEPEVHLPCPDYLTDEFFGVKWRWGYHSDGSIKNLTPHCPTPECDRQIDPECYGRGVDDYVTIYTCRSCELVLHESPYIPMKILQEVTREIERNIRAAEAAA